MIGGDPECYGQFLACDMCGVKYPTFRDGRVLNDAEADGWLTTSERRWFSPERVAEMFGYPTDGEGHFFTFCKEAFCPPCVNLKGLALLRFALNDYS